MQRESRRADGFMFFLFSNRLGCLGSLVASIVLTVLLMVVLRACGTGPA
jgi:hypothetical protein